MKNKRFKMMMSAICLILVTLTGCKGKQTENPASESRTETIEEANVEIEKLMNLDENNVVISLDKFDYYFYKNNSSISTISFNIYTMKELQEKDIAVLIDTAVPYSYEVVKEEDEKLEDLTFMSYLGVNWKELYQLAVKEPDKFEERIQTYSQKYERIEKVPVLHAYNVSIQFDLQGQDFATDIISEIEVEVDGKTHKIDGGNITLDADFILEREHKGMDIDSLVYFEVPFDINKEGVTVLPEYSFTATENLRIDDFKISHPDFHIQSMELQIEENGNVRNEKLDSLSGVEIAKGACVTIYTTVQSEKLADAFSYGASGLQIMEYTLKEEEEPQTAYSEFIMRTRLRAFDFYGHYIDGIDMLSYYYDYYNPIYGY